MATEPRTAPPAPEHTLGSYGRSYGKDKAITLEFFWYGVNAKLRIDMPPRHELSVKEARDFAYNIIDRMVAAPGVAEKDLERCATCNEFGEGFESFDNAKGERTLMCQGCIHRLTFKKRRGPAR